MNFLREYVWRIRDFKVRRFWLGFFVFFGCLRFQTSS